MRIALASWETLESIAVGGVAVHVSELAAALARRGHDVHVFTRQASGQAAYDRVAGVSIHRCPFALSPDFVHEIGNMCGAFVSAMDAAAVLTGPFEVVHAHDWLAADAMIGAKGRAALAAVLTMHSTEYGRCGNRLHEGPSVRVRERERRGVERADRIITVSHTLKREIAWLYQAPEAKIEVIYNGVQTTPFEAHVDQEAVRARLGIAPNDPFVLFAGRMTYQKGPDLLLKAIPSALQVHPNAKFVFAGDGDMRHSLQAEAGQLGIDRACRFVGHKRGRDLVELFKTADAVVVPSRNEPFGIVILEAWSAGKPVIATQNGGPSEFVWHEITGLKIRDAVPSVAWGLQEMLSDTERAQWMGRNGRIAAETAFSWDAIAERTEQVYQRALDRVVRAEADEELEAALR